ncbi:MAG: S-layer family protein, partial [Leptolyngbya sp. SIO4C1]|nr:S-layer family protein [Leptolyngbya sp. SIO4C1]
TLGQGGNVEIAADTLALDSGRISTSTRSGNGGNLTFNLAETLLLRNGSLISTAAGTAMAGGNGGDITLNLPNGFIVAVPAENSDVRANAFAGDGGNVNITARSLLGIAFRPGVLNTPLSDITASSQFGIDGTVTINEVNLDVLRDEINLPVETASPALAQGCRSLGSQAGSFVSTGRGGLPTNPIAPLSADTVWQDLDPLTPAQAGEPASGSPAAQRTIRVSPSAALVEASSWVRTADGAIALLAQHPEAAGHFVPPGSCNAQ